MVVKAETQKQAIYCTINNIVVKMSGFNEVYEVACLAAVCIDVIKLRFNGGRISPARELTLIAVEC